MFTRSVLRASRMAPRAPVSVARPGVQVTRAAFHNSAKKNDPEIVQETQVPVVSYQGGERTTEELKVGQTSTGPVSPPGADAERVAVPLNPAAYRHLTPTLAKFTCADKVVMVTG